MIEELLLRGSLCRISVRSSGSVEEEEEVLIRCRTPCLCLQCRGLFCAEVTSTVAQMESVQGDSLSQDLGRVFLPTWKPFQMARDWSIEVAESVRGTEHGRRVLLSAWLGLIQTPTAALTVPL